jgi:DNA-binding NtrC family response regulator
VVVHRPGTDPAPYAARLHVEGARRGPLQIVDAARTADVEPRTWNDPVASPLERARDGTLLVRDAHRLPEEAQQAIVRALAFRTGPATDPVPLDVRVVLAIACDDPESDDAWRACLQPALLGRMHEPPLRVPPLHRRIEDVRAIALDRLAVHGVGKGGEPFGISEEALALLVEHEWPGDDDELDVVLLVAARRAKGARIEAPDARAALAHAK